MLRLTTECYTCYHWLPPLLMRYRRKFPRVEVRIDVEATRAPIEMLLAGRIDLAIVSTAVSRSASRLAEGVRGRGRADRRARITASRSRRTSSLSELRDETLYIYPPREESRVLQEVLLPAGISPARSRKCS